MLSPYFYIIRLSQYVEVLCRRFNKHALCFRYMHGQIGFSFFTLFVRHNIDWPVGGYALWYFDTFDTVSSTTNYNFCNNLCSFICLICTTNLLIALMSIFLSHSGYIGNWLLFVAFHVDSCLMICSSLFVFHFSFPRIVYISRPLLQLGDG